MQESRGSLGSWGPEGRPGCPAGRLRVLRDGHTQDTMDGNGEHMLLPAGPPGPHAAVRADPPASCGASTSPGGKGLAAPITSRPHLCLLSLQASLPTALSSPLRPKRLPAPRGHRSAAALSRSDSRHVTSEAQAAGGWRRRAPGVAGERHLGRGLRVPTVLSAIPGRSCRAVPTGSPGTSLPPGLALPTPLSACSPLPRLIPGLPLTNSSWKAAYGLTDGVVAGLLAQLLLPHPPPTRGRVRVGRSVPATSSSHGGPGWARVHGAPGGPLAGPWGGHGVLTGLRDHTVVVSWGALHQRLAVLVATAHMAVQGPGWGESTGPSQSGPWGAAEGGDLGPGPGCLPHGHCPVGLP